ncbi:hypothetical protein HRED_07836 [Candidatus Haloredivivus sp. G17]|nr:hypothetical protein HRED_07836 [Candidatus Haloredivivus sp. G17]
MNREDLHQHYSEKRPEIESRLEEFKALREASDKRLFKELCFVIFTSQSSAEKAWEAAEELDEKNILAERDTTILGREWLLLEAGLE